MGEAGGVEGPPQLDAGALLEDWEAELRRGAAQHWWAEGMDQTGAPLPFVLGWQANRDVLTDRRLSPRSFVEDMVANGISESTALQISPLFSRHGAEHRHLRAVVSQAFTARKVEQLRPATRAVTERLADGIEAVGGRCDVVAAFAEPLPPEVFALLFGLPVEDRTRMGAWAAAIAPASRRRPPRCVTTAWSASPPGGPTPGTISSPASWRPRWTAAASTTISWSR